MAEVNVVTSNWLSGELSSNVYGRYDTPSYRKGAKVIKNFTIKEQGPIAFRQGFEYITSTKSNKKAKLHRFIFNDDLTFVLEFTDQTLRFYKDGALVLNGGNPYEVVTPYLESDDLTLLKVAQNANTMYIVHPKYAPKKLTRTSDTSWTLASVSGTSYPFTSSGNYPRAVAFAQGRLWYGGTDNAPDAIWGSKGPLDDGTTNYDNFTTGTADTSAIKYFLAPPNGRVEAIEWISSNNKFLLVGTYGGVSKVNGGDDNMAVTPTAVNVRQIATHGCNPTQAEAVGSSVYYVQRNRLRIRDIRYMVEEDAYVAVDCNLISTEITGPGVAEIAYCQGNPDILWGACTDGILIGMTTNKIEAIRGWHRHTVGGDGVVESLISVPRASNPDDLYISVRRTINGNTVRYVERLSSEIRLPQFIDFYTGDEEDDTERWYNSIYQTQLGYRFLDSHKEYDGSDYATHAITITPITDSSVRITASAPTFSGDWVNKQIWGKYGSLGIGGGRYDIKNYTSSTQVTANVLSASALTTLTLGNWYLTTDVITGLSHLEGETVGVFAGGTTHGDRTVSSGQITLDAHYPVVAVGLKYIGVFESLDVELGGSQEGAKSSLGIKKRVKSFDVKLLDTLGASVGTSPYNQALVEYADTSQRLGMPPRPFSGIKHVPVVDGYNRGGVDDTEKHLVIIQEQPQPCQIQIINARIEAAFNE